MQEDQPTVTKMGSVPETRKVLSDSLIYKGEVNDVLDKLTNLGIGVGVFFVDEIDQIKENLKIRGYIESIPGNSRVGTDDKQSIGELHRHGNGELIVHRTLKGHGTANFYWPTQELDEFNPGINEVKGQVTGLVFGPEVVIVFPSQTWHQFNTDPYQDRHSGFVHFIPSEK